jgi:hypothetical protein
MPVPRRYGYPLLVMLLLLLAGAACTLFSAESLNDGKGTRENPVPARVYAKTTSYNVRALSVVWPQVDQADQPVDDMQTISVRLQVEIQCERADDEICQLEEIGREIKLVDGTGALYDPVDTETVEEPLTGEILGKAEKAGWLLYEVPRGIEIKSAVAEYEQDQRVFFNLP